MERKRTRLFEAVPAMKSDFLTQRRAQFSATVRSGCDTLPKDDRRRCQGAAGTIPGLTGRPVECRVSGRLERFHHRQ